MPLLPDVGSELATRQLESVDSSSLYYWEQRMGYIKRESRLRFLCLTVPLLSWGSAWGKSLLPSLLQGACLLLSERAWPVTRSAFLSFIILEQWRKASFSPFEFCDRYGEAPCGRPLLKLSCFIQSPLRGAAFNSPGKDRMLRNFRYH